MNKLNETHISMYRIWDRDEDSWYTSRSGKEEWPSPEQALSNLGLNIGGWLPWNSHEFNLQSRYTLHKCLYELKEICNE